MQGNFMNKNLALFKQFENVILLHLVYIYVTYIQTIFSGLKPWQE